MFSSDISGIALILFWIATKIISTQRFNTTSITKLMEIHNIIPPNIISKHNLLCEMLKWNLDPDTAYSYIQYIPKQYHRDYLYLNCLLLYSKNSEKLSEFEKATSVYIIIKYHYDIEDSDMDKEISSAINDNYIDTHIITNNCRIVANIIKCIYTHPKLHYITGVTGMWKNINPDSAIYKWINVYDI